MAITYKLELNSKPKDDNTCGILLRITENTKEFQLVYLFQQKTSTKRLKLTNG
jgi:hypothetical protein